MPNGLLESVISRANKILRKCGFRARVKVQNTHQRTFNYKDLLLYICLSVGILRDKTIGYKWLNNYHFRIVKLLI